MFVLSGGTALFALLALHIRLAMTPTEMQIVWFCQLPPKCYMIFDMLWVEPGQLSR
jgi:hypothetical protein